MPSRTKPPFRAEQVGSLLRPKEVLDARSKFERKEISVAQLREIEDKAIRYAVKRQEECGLQCATDGELRRGTWHMDFLGSIGGIGVGGMQMRPFKNETGAVENEILLPKVVGRLHLAKTIFGDDFTFLRSITNVTPKLTIPSPSMLHGLGSMLQGNGIYKDETEFLTDLVKVYVDEIKALANLGCSYLQIDDTMFASLGDPAYRDQIRGTSSDGGKRHLTYIRLINEALKNRPDGLTVGVHTCRGNHRSAWVAAGSYDEVAEAVFNGLNVDAFFLEYDDARSGSFEPLRFVPKAKTVVLGLVTTKKGELEKKDNLKRRIDEAAKFVPLDQLALSPQCGFASTLLGNLLSEEEQYAKLRLVAETAREVWH